MRGILFYRASLNVACGLVTKVNPSSYQAGFQSTGFQEAKTRDFAKSKLFVLEKENLSPNKTCLPKLVGSKRNIASILPSPVKLLNKDEFKIAYSLEGKHPIWVHEVLNKDKMQRLSDRPNKKFRQDPELPAEAQASHRDYKKSGFSRGHLAACGNYSSNSQKMKDTFIFSNAVPQNTELNGQMWGNLEAHSRRMTDIFKRVHVISGPLYLSQSNPLSLHKRKIHTIGRNQIPVPTHLFKVIMAENEQGQPLHLQAYLVPNVKPENGAIFKEHEVSFKQVSRLSGIDFLSLLDVNDKQARIASYRVNLLKELEQSLAA